MPSISFRNRILLALVLLGAVPTSVAILGWAVTLRRTTPIAGRATLQELGTSGRALTEVIDTTILGPAARSTLQAHLRELNDALSLANRAVAYNEARTLAFMVAVAFLGVLLIWAAVRLARGLSRQLSHPIDELIGWTVMIRRGEPLPPDPPRGGAPEFASLRTAMQETSRELHAGRAAELEAERLRAFREVARRVAHEMKNPLTPVRFAVSQLSRTASAEQLEAIEVLRAESARLEALAREFANLGRLPEGPAADVDLGELLHEVLRSSVPAGLTCHLAIQPGVPHIHGHYDPLRRAFANLVLNAVEACGGEGRLDVSVRSERGGVLVSLADHGPGIPDEDRSRIFEPYFTRKSDGTGLGLAIVRQAVDLHHGTVLVRETPGGGATFDVWLPAAEFVPGRPAAGAGSGPPGAGPVRTPTYLAPDGRWRPDRRQAERRAAPESDPDAGPAPDRRS